MLDRVQKNEKKMNLYTPVPVVLDALYIHSHYILWQVIIPVPNMWKKLFEFHLPCLEHFVRALVENWLNHLFFTFNAMGSILLRDFSM